jgi:hypothetical protein
MKKTKKILITVNEACEDIGINITFNNSLTEFQVIATLELCKQKIMNNILIKK